MEYLNREKVMEVNSKIIEYDLYHANTSLMRFYNLCPTKLIDKIDSLTKMSREVYVGKLQRDNKEFSKALMKSFDDAMKLFLDTNGITEDNIISIKKDAAFVVNKKVVQTDFDCLHFRPKNEYIGYALIGLYEIYFKSNGEADVKGIADRDALDLHKNGILRFVKDLMSLYAQKDKIATSRYLHEFIDNYKKKLLPFDYYREFNTQSAYKCFINNEELILDELDESVIDTCDISWNYFNVILPAMRIFI